MPLRLTRRLLPHPLLTLLLVVVWCLLNNSLTLGTVVFGTILGLLIPILTSAYWPDRPPVARPFGMIVYCVIVIFDIIKSNITVALQILFRGNDSLQPAWITVPLDLRKPEAITILAGSITLTPGTLSADLSADGTALLVHALHAPDPDAVRDDIKARYESRLKEIFA
ncbi:multisubunit potassium/proton antiporter, PhaE subunit [Loktanella atrilutea]|uniref:Multisubunit potassium/proton antiporter, PhaE subunit n=1 Tax=Loktanella atrilutea TaxID=366533 RepID=A0A1M5DTL4_LOKAT|nr:Na+/H+ antiporter subunit E [Loktanella atrilutea]SHF70142.1 multisubunit potassium/proton antiporter, PhaE subunit [Loktanella atrilutea]